MLQFSNDNTVSIHVTKACNLRCEHCYQKEYNDSVNLNRIKLAIDKINPQNIVFYGGEPLLKPQIIWDIIKTYPDKGRILHTNGTIWMPKILDRMDVLYLTIEAFLFKEMQKYRPVNRKQYETIMRILSEYKHKIILIHNIYPQEHDETFYRISRLYGVKVQSYPIIMPISKYVLDKESSSYIATERQPLVKPKLRILEDGTITRDMRGVYNICRPEDWKEEYRNYELPVSDKCRSCHYYTKCPACNMFPHFCKDILEEIDKPHFCGYTEELWAGKNYKGQDKIPACTPITK